jgi:hypothetical protein
MSSFKLRKEKNCLNCGHEVEKHFCPQCGQENIEVKEDAFHMVVHAVADYFHFEHKFFGTLKPLLLKPGKLTEAYVSGKRVSFIHPIRLYIFVSIVFFLVILGGQAKQNEVASQPKKQSSSQKITPQKADSIVNETRKAMKYAPMSDRKREKVLSKMRENLINGNKTKSSSNYNFNNDVSFGGDWAPKDTTVVQYEKSQLALPKEKRDGFIKHYFAKRSIELNAYPNPQQKFLEDLVHNVPKMMFFILPIFAMILKLVYIRKKRYYFEHLIYSFHVHAALFIAVLITKLLMWIVGNVADGEWFMVLCMIYMLWYIYRSLRTFYGSTRWVTLLKMFFLFVCYNIVLTLGFLLIIALSFALV